MKKPDYFQDHLEWEILEPEQEITNLTFETGLYSLSKTCIIRFSRDNQYDLVATISGIVDNAKDLNPNIKNIQGEIVSAETIIGYSIDGLFKYKLSDVVLGASKTSYISVSNPTSRFQAELIVNKIERSFNGSKNEIECLQEWYLTGTTSVIFPRSTYRSVDKSYKRLREGVDSENEISLGKSNLAGRDYLIVNLIDTSYIVSKVPKEYGPNWSFNLSIEYRQSFGRIPNMEEREAISEIVGFVLGNQLLKVGQTNYDKSHSLILQEYQDPWGDNVVSRCQRQGFQPVDISKFDNWGRVETLLNELTPKYLTERKRLRLNDALWKYWLSKYSSLGANLPILSSAVETLAERILKNHPEIKLYYIAFNVFAEMIKDELDTIEKKLDGISQKDIILNKLKGASQRGSNEKLEMMFEIIELPIDIIERKAIKARNKMAHSSIGEITDEEIKETLRMTRAYETLFNRVLLKILSYNGEYVDYYTLGYPNRPINEPIQEEKQKPIR